MNRERARHLFITQKTVETHLRNVLDKLGILACRDPPAVLESQTA